eukprot:TRINITY_DN22448_c0_g1_i1.p1 TRINITY_DN22448_c0_g1~~TRINITY_DN22448_c0_g1_i1.p1  ORF type:complete len:442 (+),score=61.12 TRINITY_DN22448_c0_g1_i1:167-1492(+)
MSGIALLCERSRSYLKTIKKRGEFLAAAERFYLEVLVCQWRLEALDVQLRAATMCSSAAVVGATVDGDSSTAIQMSLGDAISRRREILNGVHSEITSHQEAARAAIEDRATHYGLSAAPTCHVDRLARGKVERGRALERLRQLVDNTYADIILESHGMVRISLDDDGLRRLRASIDRRHKYWQAELEDTWAAWQGATKKMHDLGDQALRAWNELATTAISLLRVRAWPTCMREEFAKGLGLAVVDIFEAEHLESLGLSGLRDTSSPSPCGVSRSARNCGNDVSVCGAAGDVKAFAVPEFSTAGRLYLIAAILELLHRADGLHFVGDALLKCELASHDGLPGNNIPATAPHLRRALLRVWCLLSNVLHADAVLDRFTTPPRQMLAATTCEHFSRSDVALAAYNSRMHCEARRRSSRPLTDSLIRSTTPWPTTLQTRRFGELA